MEYFHCGICHEPTNFRISAQVTKTTWESTISWGSNEPIIALKYEAVLLCPDCYDKIENQVPLDKCEDVTKELPSITCTQKVCPICKGKGSIESCYGSFCTSCNGTGYVTRCQECHSDCE
jgi:hypothetical protein